MDIRCGSCSKLFRVADEKISGKGIRFKCTRCGEIVTVTKQDFEMDLLAREGGDEVPAAQQAPPMAAPPRPAVPSAPPSPPAAPEAQEYKPPPPEPEGSAAQDDASKDAPRAGLEDFDFSAPDVAAQHAQQRDAGLGGFAFGDQGGLDEQETTAGEMDETAGEVSISEEEAQAAEGAFSFPADMISEPKRRPAFTLDAEETPEADSGTADDRAMNAELDLSGMGEAVPELTTEPQPAPVQPKSPPAPTPPKTGPVFTPPPRTSAPQSASGDEGLDLGAALSIPRTARDRDDTGPAGAPGGHDERAGADTASFPVPAVQDGELHPLASGNMTGAVTGIGCALPIGVLMFFGLGLVAKFAPFLARLPLLHLVAVTGAGIVSISIMIGILIAVLQAKAGRKLFFLVNILIGSLFGAGFGGGMMAVIALASGESLNIVQIAGGAVNGGITACLLSIVLVIVRRIMLFTKSETFSAPLMGGQKAGLALSLIIILAAGYGQGALTGKLEQAAQTMVEQFQAEITPDGLSVVNATAYVDNATGDLVITGNVRNGLNQPKPGWYLEVKVYDASGSVVATVAMVNDVQILSRKDFHLLEKRGKDIKALKAQMALAVQAGEVPANGNVPFEVHLMGPPAGIASFLPVLKTFDPAATFRRMAVEMGDR